ncbi:EAL domain-containing response regulator [Pelomonas sp. SE-A7]|uniref:EAL domain-containing response regulator n=1 Tax=Pelomonas sp. SE-A7 TaxID=3054953 RepID=UPI00259C93AE|nr:EAL domain-containing response regulator [Pelomonas sp. SE-A7]MDM4764457.1 EAL domain-containing response regulator [Pelomonas sp. SE-A7]
MQATAGHAGPPAAMVVEDSDLQRAQLVQMLGERRPGPVLQARDGLEALRLLQRPDTPRVSLLLTDIDMPGMDGIELVQHLVQSGQVEQLIVTSGRDPRLLETIESMFQGQRRLRLLGTLPKPVRADALERLLEKSGPGQSQLLPDEEVDTSEAALRLALERGEFLAYFQPKLGMARGILHGFEALARWQHPTHGLLGPQNFLRQIEGTPLRGAFTLAIVEQGLRWLSQWHRSMPQLGLSFNLCADDLADIGFVNQLIQRVAAHKLPAQRITWEVTETTMLGGRAMAHLARLSLKGFGLSMDDFGIGYSSMHTLSRSPFTELKIDRIFVHGAAERANRRAILCASLDMGRNLGLRVVAEGVETQADWQLLRELGCHQAQGFLVGRPVPGAEVLDWVRGNRTRLSALVEAHAVAA